MFKRVVAITAILIATSVAWAILGSTIFYRTYDANSALAGRVASSWGAPEVQNPPAIGYEWQSTKEVEKEENGKKVMKTETITGVAPVALESSNINADIHLDYRQKGLLWFSAYAVKFTGSYGFQNATSTDREFVFRLPFPGKKAVYDNVELLLDGMPLPLQISGEDASARAHIAAGARGVLRASYRSQGLDSWEYEFGKEISQVRDFHLTLNTDFSGFDFPENSMSPTEKRQTGNGWELKWNYENLVSGFNIALKMPQKLQPGPLAGRISYFAPVSLFFFFFIVFILSTLGGFDFHPMNYFFLACAFFAFHLLLAYLADHISIHAAFLISSMVSVGLVVSYLRLVVNWQFALREAGLAQLVYLVLFSYAFFFEGFTGLAITIGAIITLFVVMQFTGKIRWQEKFAVAAQTNSGMPRPYPR